MTIYSSNPDDYIVDERLALWICLILSSYSCVSVADFGCGKGYYVNKLDEFGFSVKGYDNNPSLEEFGCKLCFSCDLSEPQKLGDFDWVISLEVGEHIEKEFEQVFIDNIDKHNKHGVIISWAVPGQSGFGHVNEQPNSYIIKQFVSRGYKYLSKESKRLRSKAILPWFKNTIMVFKKSR